MPAASLADRYRAAHRECMALAQQIIDERVKLDKLAHPSLPEVALRADRMKHRGCYCLVANEILEAKP